MGGLSNLRGPKSCQNCGALFWRRLGPQQWDQTNHCSVKCAKAEYIKPPQDRIWDTCIPEPNSGCWLWLGTMTQWGYAQISLSRGVTGFAHRYSYEAFKGAIPDGLLARHTCDNRMCVNPDHLFPGTHQDNSDDMVRRGRSLIGELNHAAILSACDIPKIRDDDRSDSVIAREYSVSRPTIRRIKRREIWKHI